MLARGHGRVIPVKRAGVQAGLVGSRAACHVCNQDGQACIAGVGGAVHNASRSWESQLGAGSRGGPLVKPGRESAHCAPLRAGGVCGGAAASSAGAPGMCGQASCAKVALQEASSCQSCINRQHASIPCGIDHSRAPHLAAHLHLQPALCPSGSAVVGEAHGRDGLSSCMRSRRQRTAQSTNMFRCSSLLPPLARQPLATLIMSMAPWLVHTVHNMHNMHILFLLHSSLGALHKQSMAAAHPHMPQSLLPTRGSTTAQSQVHATSPAPDVPDISSSPLHATLRAQRAHCVTILPSQHEG